MDEIRVHENANLGILELVPMRIMEDKRLTIEAKAVYVYYLAFENDGNAMPNIDKVSADLCISEIELKKNIDCLIKLDYLEAIRRK